MTSKKKGRIFIIQEKNHVGFFKLPAPPPCCLPVICYAFGRKSACAVRFDRSSPLILPLLEEKSTLPLKLLSLLFSWGSKEIIV